MATHLDLEEQEQLDQLKDFWKQYGSLITWVLILGLAALAGWRGWLYLQAQRAQEASALFEQLDLAAQAGDADRAAAVFGDMKSRYPGVAYTSQGALLAAKVEYLKGKTQPAIETLKWAAENATDDEFRSLARLRLAGVLLEAKQYDEALKWLGSGMQPAFEGLAADRRGDILMAQGKRTEAVAAYQAAWKALDPMLDYRRVVQTKLETLGVPPEADKAAAGKGEGA